MRDIGNNIKTARIRKKLTQDELAEKLYVTRQTVSNYENGKSRPDVEFLISISDILGVELEELLYGCEKENAQRKKFVMFTVVSVIAAVVWGVTLISISKFIELASSRYIIAPMLLVKGVVFPALYFALGWVALLGCEILLGAKPPKVFSSRYVRIAYLTFIGVIFAILLTVAVPLAVNIITWLKNNTYAPIRIDRIPIIGNFSLKFFMFVYSNPYIALPFGAVLRLVCAAKKH